MHVDSGVKTSVTNTPWSSEGLDQCQVPIASSLLNLPGMVGSTEPSPPLTPSLFLEYFSGTIHFPLHSESCESKKYWKCEVYVKNEKL